jgi:hypothetical protein
MDTGWFLYFQQDCEFWYNDCYATAGVEGSVVTTSVKSLYSRTHNHHVGAYCKVISQLGNAQKPLPSFCSVQEQLKDQIAL